MCCAIAALVFELRRLRRRRDSRRRFPNSLPVLSSLAVCVLAAGTVLDNARFAIGGFYPAFSHMPFMKVVSYLSIFVHDVLLPLTIIAPTELMLAALVPTNARWTQTTVRDIVRLVVGMAVLGLTLFHLDRFLTTTADKLVDQVHPFPRPFVDGKFEMHAWGLRATPKPLDFIGVVVLSSCGLISGVIVGFKLRWPWYGVLQAASFAGRGAGAGRYVYSATYMFFASNGCEQVFILSLVWAGVRVWDDAGAALALGSTTEGLLANVQTDGAGKAPVAGAEFDRRLRPNTIDWSSGVGERRSSSATARSGSSETTEGEEEDSLGSPSVDVWHDASTGDTPRPAGVLGQADTAV